MDLCGPMPTESQGGNKYFLSIIDDYSRKVTVFPIRNKSDAFHTFIRFQKRAERFLSRKVIAVRTDGGLEFCNKDMDNFLTELGIKHEVTNSYTPEMNGVAERFNLTALDGIKTLLKSSEVPHKFWGEALLCFTYAWNRICHKDSNKTPFEKYSGRKPSVLHLKPFGCLAYAGVPKQIRKKFDMRAKMGIMMGYAQRTKGYRIWLIDENKLVETINVRFDENKRGINFRQKVNSNLGYIYNLNLPDYYYDEDDFDRVKDSLTSRLVSKTSTETPSTSEKPDVSSDNHSLIPCTEVKWIRNIERYCKRHNIEYDPSLFNFRKDNTESQGFSDLSEQQEALMVEVTIPNCYKQAIRSRDASKWRDAMDKEINVMKELTVLAIFHDLHVDVNLYALVFGESILNDAIAIVLAGSIGNYAEMYGKGEDGFQSTAAIKSLGNFVYIFVCSFLIGSGTGCLTAAISFFVTISIILLAY
ncbi:retrovirus-related Pol polyprotein from transposon TNT 1-94 [Trichonephila clavipes]|uniref:Retrovirus-related Pol polyprotein from transposon TNT 1-94 n=1 Tax=Trichonephila clavipes TaxID=2585209 RepID=A0A8X6WIC0_TRICX|nr:retrovirus-related Pol polyprotein from transposon TNT 1-94 [Trichonephila clavipes]